MYKYRHRQNHHQKNFYVFIYIFFVFILLWSSINLGSYFILKKYLDQNTYFIKHKIIEATNLDPKNEYILELNYQVNWGFILLNLYIDNIKFYDKNHDNTNINIKKLNLSFLIYNIFNKKFIPYSIESQTIKALIPGNIFSNKSLDNKNQKSTIKKILSIKNLNIDNIDIEVRNLQEIKKYKIQNLNFERIIKKIFNIKFEYSDNNQVELIDFESLIKFDLNNKLILFYDIKNSINLRKFNKFNRIDNILINHNGSIGILLGENFNKINKAIFRSNNIKSLLKENEKIIAEIKINNSKKENQDFLIEHIFGQKTIINEFDLILNNKIKIRSDFDINYENFSIKSNISSDSTINTKDIDMFWPQNFFQTSKDWYENFVNIAIANDINLALNLKFNQNWNFLEKKSNINGSLNANNIEIDLKSFPIIKNISGYIKFNLFELKSNIKTGSIYLYEENIDLGLGEFHFDFLKNQIEINGALKSETKRLINIYDKNFKLNILGEDIIKKINNKSIVDFSLLIPIGKDFKIFKKINIESKNIDMTINSQNNPILFNSKIIKMNINNIKNYLFHEFSINLDANLFDKKINLKSEFMESFDNEIITDFSSEINYNDIKDILNPIIGSVIKVDGKIFSNIKIIHNIKTNQDKIELLLDLKDTFIEAKYLNINKKNNENAKIKMTINHNDATFIIENFEFYYDKYKVFIEKIEYNNNNLKIFDLLINQKSLIELIDVNLENKENIIQIFAEKVFYEDFNWLEFNSNKKSSNSNSIHGIIKTFELYNNLNLKNLYFDIKCDTNTCHTIEIKNDKINEKKSHLDLKINNFIIDLYSDNAGLIFRGMNIIKYIYDGEVKLKGYLNQYKNNEFIIQNDMSIKNFYLKKAPLVAHILSTASITGAFSDLSGKGISFKKMKSSFVYHNNKIEFGKSIADGFSIGFSFDSKIDINNSVFNIHGSVIPFNFINLILRPIPLVGQFICGRPGEGFFSIDFESYGKFEKPSYKVNLFKAFMPNIIKKFLYRNYISLKFNSK